MSWALFKKVILILLIGLFSSPIHANKVLTIQELLAKLGYEPGPIDGEYGNKTRDKEEETPKPAKDTATEHRGFGFATFTDSAIYQKALDAGTIRGSAKSNSKRKHTLYIRPVVREEEGADSDAATASSSGGGNRNICFLWTKSRCPYGDGCKFVHEGPGGLLTKVNTKKKQKMYV